MGVGDSLHGKRIAGTPVHVYRQQGGCARRDRGCNGLGVQIEAVRVDIHEYRCDAAPHQGVGSRNERKWSGDDFA